jgi:hypothetical protein
MPLFYGMPPYFRMFPRKINRIPLEHNIPIPEKLNKSESSSSLNELDISELDK